MGYLDGMARLNEAGGSAAPELLVERAAELAEDDMHALCEAADAAILEGGGFGWVKSPGRLAFQSYFRGVLLVPERELFIGRLDGVIVGSAQLVRPPRNNEAQAFAAHLTHSFVAPYARGHGLAKLMTARVEEGARHAGAAEQQLGRRRQRHERVRHRRASPPLPHARAAAPRAGGA